MTGTQRDSRRHRLPQLVWAVVVVLGLTSFAMSLGSTQFPDYPVRLSVLAATVAAIGLLPGQAMRGWVVAAVAVAGLLDSLTTCARVGAAGGPLTSLVVLDLLQSFAAVLALLLDARLFGAAESSVQQEYSAYQRLAQAYQEYAAQYQQYCQTYPDPHGTAAQAEAHAHPNADATGGRSDAAQESFVALQARYARQGIGSAAQQSRGTPGEMPTGRVADIGVADRKNAVPESYSYPRGQQPAEPRVSEPT
jgi:hypothetical protein